MQQDQPSQPLNDFSAPRDAAFDDFGADSEDRRRIGRFWRMVLLILTTAGFTAAITTFWVFPVAIPLSLIVLFAATALLVLAMLATPIRLYRKRRALIVLGHVLSAVTLRMPLPKYLRAAATGEPHATRRKLIRVAKLLESGSSIAAALRDVANDLPPLSLDRLAVAEQNFSFETTAARLVEQLKLRTQTVDPTANSGAYFCVLAWCLAAVTGIILTYVEPKMVTIMANFHITPPPIMRLLLLPATGAVANGAMLVFTLILLGVVFEIGGRLLPVRQRPYGWSSITDRFAWHAPILGRIVQGRNAAAVCEALATAFAAGRPAPEAVASANLPSLNSVLSRRLTRWQRNVEAGRPLGQSARESGIPRLLAELLGGAQLDLSGAAAFAGRAYAATSERQILMLRAATPIMITTFFAVGVSFIALSVIQPMALLIDSVAIKVYP